MIARIWHGYTTRDNSSVYEIMLREEILAGIRKRKICGLIDIQLMIRKLSDEVEFVTIMRFDSLTAVKEFAGDDYERAVIYEDAKPLLLRYDERSQHYEIRDALFA
jgi:antibiotic biosynthesis monooxygenase (ABM) superfamily enzyme